MAFQIKNFVSIAAAMINRMKAVQSLLTDFNVGAAARTVVEAVAIELDQYYQQMFNGLKEAIPVAIYNSFGFPLLPAQASRGLLTFTATVSAFDQPILAGAVVTVPGGTIRYVTQANAVIPAGDTTVSVEAAADTVGLVSNAAPGTITQLVGSIAGVTGVTNTLAFGGGQDAETEDQRKTRFQSYIQSLGRGQVYALQYGAQTAYLLDSYGNIVESVISAIVQEMYYIDDSNPIGLIHVFIFNGSTGASSDLIAKCQQIIDGYTDTNGNKIAGYKAAGTIVVVNACFTSTCDVTGVVTLLPAYASSSVAVLAACTAAVNAYIASLPVGTNIIQEQIRTTIMNVPGVYNVVLSAPGGDVTIAYNYKALPGTIALTT